MGRGSDPNSSSLLPRNSSIVEFLRHRLACPNAVLLADVSHAFCRSSGTRRRRPTILDNEGNLAWPAGGGGGDGAGNARPVSITAAAAEPGAAAPPAPPPEPPAVPPPPPAAYEAEMAKWAAQVWTDMCAHVLRLSAMPSGRAGPWRVAQNYVASPRSAPISTMAANTGTPCQLRVPSAAANAATAGHWLAYSVNHS